MNWVLVSSSIAVGAVHAIAPDHWLPIAMIGRARRWTPTGLLAVTFAAGLGHVVSSIILAGVGLALGFGFTRMKGIEESRGLVAGLLLIGFGVGYSLWGLKHIRRHDSHAEEGTAVSTWVLIAIFVLGPCEPLIPLMFLAASKELAAVVVVAVSFSVATIAVMLAATWAAYSGVRLMSGGRAGSLFDRHAHTLAGAVVALTGVAVLFGM